MHINHELYEASYKKCEVREDNNNYFAAFFLQIKVCPDPVINLAKTYRTSRNISVDFMSL
jgi:hypothetical protein